MKDYVHVDKLRTVLFALSGAYLDMVREWSDTLDRVSSYEHDQSVFKGVQSRMKDAIVELDRLIKDKSSPE